MATPQLTFGRGVAGYLHEGAHTVYWLVHPFRPVLAPGPARGGSSAGRLAHIPAAAPDWRYRARGVCVDSCGVVFAGAVVGWEERLVTKGWYHNVFKKIMI
jgi:hypothetical protein